VHSPAAREVAPTIHRHARFEIAIDGESHCDARVAPIYTRYTDVQTTILAGAGEIQLHLKTQRSSLQTAARTVDHLMADIEEELGDCVFSDNGDSLEQIVGYYLQSAERYVGSGRILHRRAAGRADHFHQRKFALLPRRCRRLLQRIKDWVCDVPAGLIKKHGAVSREVAASLAEGIRKRCGATLGWQLRSGRAIRRNSRKTGWPGFHALATESETEVSERNFTGDRNEFAGTPPSKPWT